ncbi:YdeI/OmpD-associated family protein [Leucobacter chromiiresistens]
MRAVNPVADYHQRMAQRARHSMPADVENALRTSNTRSDYDARPAYQRNDYIGWISRAKSAETRSRRIAQMIDELSRGGVYMNMTHAPSRRHAP